MTIIDNEIPCYYSHSWSCAGLSTWKGYRQSNYSDKEGAVLANHKSHLLRLFKCTNIAVCSFPNLLTAEDIAQSTDC